MANTAEVRDDGTLVSAAKAGDKGAFTELVERHSQFVFGNARAVGADRTMAEDVVQIVWFKLASRLDAIREPDRIRAWLAITTRNTARTELGRTARTVAIDDRIPDAAPGPESLMSTRIEHAELSRCMKRLTDQCRELLLMRFVAEMSLQEISEAREMPMGSIGPTQGRCLKQLSTCLSRSA